MIGIPDVIPGVFPNSPDVSREMKMNLVTFANIYRKDWYDIDNTISRTKRMFPHLNLKDKDFFVWKGNMNEYRDQKYIIIVLPLRPTFNVCMFLINLRMYKRCPNPDNAVLYDKHFKVRVYTKVDIKEWIKQDERLWRVFGRSLCTMYARGMTEDDDEVEWNY